MGLFGWLFGSTGFEQEPDAFTISREKLWPEIRKAIDHQQKLGRTVWLTTHFADQFFETQNYLGQWQLEYQLISQPVDAATMLNISRQQPRAIFLALAELLTATEQFQSTIDHSTSITFISLERHPAAEFDQQLEEFARQIPCRVKFGYYLALDDPIFGTLSQSLTATLQQLGLKDGELINSFATSRSIKRLQHKLSANADLRLRADSAAEWLALQKQSS